MRHQLLGLALLLAPMARLEAQWQLQDANTTADLRGIDSLGNGVAWASGTNGTVLRTEDAGFVWQLCAIPPNADHLDFRAIQAFDNNTAIVMSSGKGDLSRLYKTTDGCQTWTLLFTNPDEDGFWDALTRTGPRTGPFLLLGDPVAERFPIRVIYPDGHPIVNFTIKTKARDGEAAFAASNSSLYGFAGGQFLLVTGGTSGSRAIRPSPHAITDELGWMTYPGAKLPLGSGSDSSGAFSVTFKDHVFPGSDIGVTVGGDYKQPDQVHNTAAFTSDGGKHWVSSATPPHGYRSAVAFDPKTNTWITVGPNGTDISTDDGGNWRPVIPGPADPPDADQHWNALSLPFVVGPHGRIATLRANALTNPTSKAK